GDHGLVASIMSAQLYVMKDCRDTPITPIRNLRSLPDVSWAFAEPIMEAAPAAATVPAIKFLLEIESDMNSPDCF
ncbi:MAG: hypothetical protein RLN96_08355, partial [Pseudomonadales bacterium]